MIQAEWMWILSQTVTQWLSSAKSDPLEPVPINQRGVMLKTTPAVRTASHMFTKVGPLLSAVYKGQWRRGLMNGEGQIVWADGRVYTGQFTEGEQTG